MTDTLGTNTATGAIREAAVAWIDSLGPDQVVTAVHTLDSPSRYRWDYRPATSTGLALADMDDRQRDLAFGMVQASLSARAATEVRDVIERETVLGAIERRYGGENFPRDPGRYWFASYGDPRVDEAWTWRVGGHHVWMHLAVVSERPVVLSPAFLGANPALVPDLDGLPEVPVDRRRLLAAEEELARDLLGAMDTAERRIAIVDEVAPHDILSGNDRAIREPATPAGISLDRLRPAPREALEALIRHYVDRAVAPVAASELERIGAAGPDSIAFAWAGPMERGRGHYYVIRGPDFLIEYDNTQDDANHVHSVWRRRDGDWGDDLLGRHYATAHRHPAAGQSQENGAD